MADAPSPDALLSQSLAVLRQCVPTLETAAARAPTVAELRDTMAALRGVESALHQHRDALRRGTLRHPGTAGGGLSHEIRNPLGALFLHIDLLEEELREPSDESLTVIQQTFGDIRTALTRLDELVQDYLPGARQHHRAGRAGRGRGRAGMGGGDAEPGGATGGHRGAGGTRHGGAAGLSPQHPATGRAQCRAECHRGHARGGTLRLACIRTATEVQVRIRDSGIGIPAEHVPRIFEPSIPRNRGHWLGLYIVREILVAHGGRVTVERGGAGHHLYPDVPRARVTAAMRLRREGGGA